jgi:hypothetical protein
MECWEMSVFADAGRKTGMCLVSAQDPPPGGARIHATPKNKRISKKTPYNRRFTIIYHYKLLFIGAPPVFTSLLYRSDISIMRA